jgi:putative peptidoglycan lipid II flippase
MKASSGNGASIKAGLLRFASVGGVLIVSRAAYAIKDVFVAQRFGTSDALDAFMASSILPLFFSQTLGTVLADVFLPVFVRLRETQREEDSRALLATLTRWGIVATGLLCGLLFFAAEPATVLLAHGFPPEKVALSALLLRSLLPLIVFGVTSALLNAALVAAGRSVLVSATQILTPVLTLLLLYAFRRPDPTVLVAGPVVGSLLEAMVALLALRTANIRMGKAWRRLNEPLRSVSRQFVPLLAAQIFSAGSVLVDQAMSAALSAGAISSLAFGTKATLAGLNICNVSLALILSPRFAQLAARRDWGSLRRSYFGHLGAVFLFACAVTVPALVFSEQIISLLFERGAFSHADTLRAAEIQRYFALQIPFHLAGLVGVQLLIATGRARLMLAVTPINLAVNCLGNWLLSRSMGVAGIALSTTVVMVVSCLGITILTQRVLQDLSSDDGAQPTGA